MTEVRIQVIHSVSEICAEDWGRLAGANNPFVGLQFLQALEQGGALTAERGWIPRYLVARTPADEAVGFVPLFVKLHSYGEYFFDHAWASPMQRQGLQYYPKMTVAIPFTPATGERIWIADGWDREELGKELIRASIWVGQQLKVSSIHWLFCSDEEQRWLASAQFSPRFGIQYHWSNQEYIDFEHMLSTMTRKRRKEIRRERKKATTHGLRFVVLDGTQLTSVHWTALHQFYQSTVAAHYAMPYLTPEVFQCLEALQTPEVVASFAMDGNNPVAGTLNFRRGNNLYGRYWGSLISADCLHFELCYYQLQNWCIQQKIQTFEAGAQGPHKHARGFLPTLTRAAVYVFHEGYQSAIHDFLMEEHQDILAHLSRLRERSPFVTTG